MIDREAIEKMIFQFVKDVLNCGDPSFTETEITEAISILYDSFLCKIQYAQLDGFSKTILPSLANLSKNNITHADLQIISTSLEAFVKRYVIILAIDSYNNTKDKTLVPLLKQICINQDLTDQGKSPSYPQLDDSSLESYRAKKQYLYYLCLTYLTRNEVHNSPDWSMSELTRRFEATLVMYVYIILKNSDNLAQEVSTRLSNHTGSSLNNEENKWLYDFITYGRSTAELRTRIVDAFILNRTYDTCTSNKEQKTTELYKDLAEELGSSITEHFVDRRIKRLQTEKKIELDCEKLTLSLTGDEINRVESVRRIFRDNRDLFFLYFDDILTKYGIEKEKDSLIEKLQKLFVDNFNLDLSEIFEKGTCDSNNQYHICSNFITKDLVSITGNDESAKTLFKDLLELCIQSDFLLCISASTVFSNISNIEKYQQYINQPSKDVYLDTQIILYSLCVDFRKNCFFDNTMYKTVKELCTESLKHADIHLNFSQHYISEIVFQLKNALGLIVFDRQFKFSSKGKLSTNIFYQFFCSLKSDNILEDDYAFEDFMDECFSLYEEDLYDSSFQNICTKLIKDKLNELGYIEVQDIPIYETAEIEKIIDETILSKKLPDKSHYVKKNDAIMIAHLANEDVHINNPFFLTWDKSFVEFRKSYNLKYSRRTAYKWHLFTPSKYVNHLALMKMSIDPKSLNEDLLSMIESFGVGERTKTIFDNHNRFLDIKNISKDKKIRYVQILKDLFNEQEFNYDSEDNATNQPNQNYGGALDALNTHFYSSNKPTIAEYRQMLLDEDCFTKVATLLKEIILLQEKREVLTDNFRDFCTKVEGMVTEFSNKLISLINKDK